MQNQSLEHKLWYAEDNIENANIYMASANALMELIMDELGDSSNLEARRERLWALADALDNKLTEVNSSLKRPCPPLALAA
jgi:hypothetical protein